jgi:hypothetical protein
MPPGHNGSASYQSLKPLPADDRAGPPSGSGTGDRPFLPPVLPQAGGGHPAQVEHGSDQPAREPQRVVDEDSEPTTPLPVILPGAASIPRPAQIETPRGPFEAATPARPTSITGSLEPPPAHVKGVPDAAASPQNGTPDELGHSAVGAVSTLPDDLSQPAEGPDGRPIPEAAGEKLDQIKDLYLTAEAIGEEALDKHFDQVSERQRELINDFFARSHPATGDVP